MTTIRRAATEAWETMFRATETIGQELSAGDAWGELSSAEYGVLYALTKDPNGVRITDLGNDVLLTQTGLSRLAARLVKKGLVERVADPDDGRAIRLKLTNEGRTAQRRIGTVHAREIAVSMTDNLTVEELAQLRDLCTKLIQKPPKIQVSPRRPEAKENNLPSSRNKSHQPKAPEGRE